MTKIAVTILDSSSLDKAWWHFLAAESERVGLTDREQWFLAKRLPYGSESRRTNKSQRFEQWLFAHGAEVRRRAGKFYLEFTDAGQATMFALKWS